MKSLNHLYKGGLILSVTLSLWSCKKQIAEPQPAEKEIAATVQSASTDCDPSILGVNIAYSNGDTYWKTLMQKWYDENGKLSYIKANISNDGHISPGEDIFMLPWGVVTYHGNQVYVHSNGQLLLRVTLNEEGQPEASYFYMQKAPNHWYTEIDTTYYYYTANRLTQMYNLRHVGTNVQSIMYNFYYDAHGNIERIQSGNSSGSVHIRFAYNYSKPSNGMLPYTYISFPFRLMEYMGVLKLPMHHEVIEFVRGAYTPGSLYEYEIFATQAWGYANHVYNANNQVEKYTINGAGSVATLYTGWNCGSTSSQSVNRSRPSHVNSLEDFKQLFPTR